MLTSFLISSPPIVSHCFPVVDSPPSAHFSLFRIGCNHSSTSRSKRLVDYNPPSTLHHDFALLSRFLSKLCPRRSRLLLFRLRLRRRWRWWRRRQVLRFRRCCRCRLSLNVGRARPLARQQRQQRLLRLPGQSRVGTGRRLRRRQRRQSAFGRRQRVPRLDHADVVRRSSLFGSRSRHSLLATTVLAIQLRRRQFPQSVAARRRSSSFLRRLSHAAHGPLLRHGLGFLGRRRRGRGGLFHAQIGAGRGAEQRQLLPHVLRLSEHQS